MLVVGAPNSSNSNRLREIAAECGVPSYLIEDADALDPRWLEGVSSVGITAGASAPDELVEELIERLREIDRDRARRCCPASPRTCASACRRSSPKPPADTGRHRYCRICNEGSPWPFRCIKRSASAPMSSGSICAGVERYPLVLMLEPLFRCNLACAGCGKIDYPDRDPQPAPHRSRECLEAVDECGAPVVVARRRRAAAAPRDRARSSKASSRARNSSISAPTRCCSKRRSTCSSRTPISPGRCISTATRRMHDRSVCQDGVYDRAVEAIRLAKSRGFRVNINATLFDNADPERVAQFFDEVIEMGSTASPCRRAMPMSARPTRRISSTAGAPRSCSATSSGATAARTLVVQPVEPVPRFPRRQPDLPLHAVGQPDAAIISAGSGRAICSAKAMPRPSRS